MLFGALVCVDVRECFLSVKENLLVSINLFYDCLPRLRHVEFDDSLNNSPISFLFSDDLKKVADRVVQVAKTNHSNDNISVLLILLKDPHKIAEQAHHIKKVYSVNMDSRYTTQNKHSRNTSLKFYLTFVRFSASKTPNSTPKTTAST